MLTWTCSITKPIVERKIRSPKSIDNLLEMYSSKEKFIEFVVRSNSGRETCAYCFIRTLSPVEDIVEHNFFQDLGRASYILPSIST